MFLDFLIQNDKAFLDYFHECTHGEVTHQLFKYEL